MPPKLNFHFRHQSSETGRYALLTQYYNALNPETELSRAEFVFSALEAYWHAFALEWEGKPKPLVRKAALNSIYRLELHIQYLREYFGLSSINPNLAAPSLTISVLTNQSAPRRENDPGSVSQPSSSQESYLAREEEVWETELDLNDEADLTADDQLIDSIF